MTRMPTNQPFDAGDAQKRGPAPILRRSIALGQVSSGILIRFQYSLWKHDPYPLVIVTDRMPDGDMRGVNLRYLTLNYVVQLIRGHCGQRGFSFRNLANDQLLVNSFRRYKSFGMRNIEMLDCEMILKTIDIVRTQDPNQEKAMREEAQKQLRRQVNPQAKEFVTGTVPGITTQQAVGAPQPQQLGNLQPGQQNFNEGG